MTAAAVAALAEAKRVGVRLRLDVDGRIKVEGTPETVSPTILARLREHKAELPAILRGDACRHCGAPIPWRRDGVAFADGTGAHIVCDARAEAERIRPPP